MGSGIVALEKTWLDCDGVRCRRLIWTSPTLVPLTYLIHLFNITTDRSETGTADRYPLWG